MSLVEKLPQSFWQLTSLNFKKYKMGSMALDECYDKQRQLYILESDKLKKEQLTQEHQRKKEKAKKVEKLMEKLQRETLNKQKTKLENVEKTDSEKEGQPTPSSEPPPVKMETQETKSESKADASKTSRLYKCEECEKTGETFETKILNVFENHLQKHPNYKPFNCESCQYSSNKRQNLHKHIRSVHKSS